MHVGYRVHAHLYCLSHSTPSYLIAEDSRGLGMLEALGELGASGIGAHRRWIGESLWSLMPRLGSQRSTASRSLGLLVARIASMPDISSTVLAQIANDGRSGFARHVQAKNVIRQTYPAMVAMLEAIP